MLRSKLLWAIVLAVVTTVLIVEARSNLQFSPLGSRIVHAVATPGAYFVGRLHPPDLLAGRWTRWSAALARTCNFLVYAFFWYACIWMTSYLRARQHPYDRSNTFVPRGF
jgi:drug/metabolite transporter (DMT)-like permease